MAHSSTFCRRMSDVAEHRNSCLNDRLVVISQVTSKAQTGKGSWTDPGEMFKNKQKNNHTLHNK